MRNKSTLGFLLLVLSFSIFYACKFPAAKQMSYKTINGQTMGTTYTIKAHTSLDNLKLSIDSVLIQVNKLFSTYDASSTISQFNQSSPKFILFDDVDNHFYNTLATSLEVYAKTNGYFDPTVMPLVNFWGFGPEQKSLKEVSNQQVEAIQSNIGFQQIQFSKQGHNQTRISSENANLSIDLSAIAKGKGVDIVGEFLDNLEIENYYIEIGGEVLTKGVNGIGQNWTIAIDKPIASNDMSRRQLHAIVQLKDEAMASSGNYRNFREVDGEVIGHTINPLTGYPEKNDLLAVSVILPTCTEADAYATGFMAMGFEKSLKTTSENTAIKALFIYMNNGVIESKYVNGFEQKLVEH